MNYNPNNSLRNIKNEFRAKYREERQKLPSERKAELDSLIIAAFVNTMVYKNCKQILLYASTEEEIGTSALAERAIADGKKLLYPRCGNDHRMDFFYVDSPSELIEGAFGISEPLTDRPYVPAETDICLVPALTYDKFGFRLGYGRGYYDRFLSAFSGIKVGFCYHSFIENSVPKGRYDIKVDVLLTEKGVYPLQRAK